MVFDTLIICLPFLLGLVSGQGLAHIMQGCEALKTLHIGFLGSALVGSHFSQALKKMLALLDLR